MERVERPQDEVGVRFEQPRIRVGAADDYVDVPRAVVDELGAHLVRAESEAFVFDASEGGPLRVHGFRARVWRPATRRAELDGLRIHDLRHTAVALWIAVGANPKEVAARAGHTSVSFTLDRYGHLYPGADTALRDRLDALYGTAQPATASPVVRLPRRAGRGPSVAQAIPGTRRAPPMGLRRRSDLDCYLVGATGFEPVTPSVSAKHREPLCSTPFSQVASDRRCRRETLSWHTGKRSLHPSYRRP